MENKKYIILDLDGVVTTINESMNIETALYWKDNPSMKELNVQYPFNEYCVKILNEILKETNAEIILSSDWKKRKTLEQLDIIFKYNNVIKSPIDITPNYRDNYSNFEYARSMEIVHYLAENIIDINNIVILDDLNLEMLFPPRLKTRFIKTHDGLTEEHKDEILKLLKNENN